MNVELTLTAADSDGYKRMRK